MKRLPRRLALWGGAAAVAAGGFAFMASNTVSASGAGEGQGTVSGYTVSHIHYTTALGHPVPGSQGMYTVTGVTFTLSVPPGTPPSAQVYTTAPTTVSVAALKTGYGPSTVLGSGTCTINAGSHPWAPDSGTRFGGGSHGWASGSGTYTCTFDNAMHVKVQTLTSLDVKANQ